MPALLGGSLAIWARGGPETKHDLDFMVKPEDAERALEALVAVGMRPEKPPEGWLYKAWDGKVLVDIIFQPRGLEMTNDVFARGDTREVLAISVNLMSLEDVFTTKLLSFDEHIGHYRADVAVSLGSLAAPEEAARRLYAGLRRFDEEGATFILAEACPEQGLGAAVMNRLLKAAGHHIIHVNEDAD